VTTATGPCIVSRLSWRETPTTQGQPRSNTPPCRNQTLQRQRSGSRSQAAGLGNATNKKRRLPNHAERETVHSGHHNRQPIEGGSSQHPLHRFDQGQKANPNEPGHPTPATRGECFDQSARTEAGQPPASQPPREHGRKNLPLATGQVRGSPQTCTKQPALSASPTRSGIAVLSTGPDRSTERACWSVHLGPIRNNSIAGCPTTDNRRPPEAGLRGHDTSRRAKRPTTSRPSKRADQVLGNQGGVHAARMHEQQPARSPARALPSSNTAR